MGEEIEVPEVAVAERLYWIPVLAAFALLLWDLVLAGRNVGDLRAARPPRTPRTPRRPLRRERRADADGLVGRPVRARGQHRGEDDAGPRRRMLLFSMLLVIPLGVFAVGTGINVALASAVRTSFAAGDYDGAAAWARAGVSLNPFDHYLPHYNLGTAYAAGDLLPEAVPELQRLWMLHRAPRPPAIRAPTSRSRTYASATATSTSRRGTTPSPPTARRGALGEQQGDVCHQDQ